MAAVFCLVLLPAIAALGFMVLAIQGQASAGTAFAASVFAMLTAFVFGSLLSMIRRAEDEEPTGN